MKWVTKNIDLFHDILIFLDVPVHTSETGFFQNTYLSEDR